jgi:hypothetical protein
MKLTASTILPQIRAMRCCELPVRSKNEAASERAPMKTVERKIKGMEKSRDRR